MKKTTCYYLSLAAIVAGGLVSCQDENQGFEESEIRASVYEREFLKEFGVPADNHKWGFDVMSFYLNSGEFYPTTRASETYQKKQDMFIDGIPVLVAFSKPADITQREYEEVTAWFSNHQVTWTNTPAIFDGTNSTRNPNGGIAKEITSDFNYGTMKDPEHINNNQFVDVPFGEIVFHNGWIQHVSSPTNTNVLQSFQTLNFDRNKPMFKDESGNYWYKESDNLYKPCTNMGQDDQNRQPRTSAEGLTPQKTGNLNTGNQMDLLSIHGLTPQGAVWDNDVFDTNHGNGYGYGNQSGFNASLIYNTDFNSWQYHNTYDAQWHDKYFVVYLEGDGYSGYYLGFDFECLGNAPEKVVAADGICIDWIIKIGEAGNTQYKDARVMCEDLGTNDFDFNDVVIDLQLMTHNDDINHYNQELDKYKNGQISERPQPLKQVVKVTVKAVGGTIPVCLAYGDHSSSEVESVAFKKGTEHELHKLFGKPTTTPINVGSKGETSTQEVSWIVQFNNAHLPGQKADIEIKDGSVLDFQKFNIYVRHSDKAEWLNVKNYDETGKVNAPQKFCIPIRRNNGTEIMWPEENEPIKSKYPKFKDWIENPTKKFWE